MFPYQTASQETCPLQPESTTALKFWGQESERIEIIFLIDVENESCEECSSGLQLLHK